ncbi:MAG: Helix-turn-helix type 11 domain protein, partial [Paenibacillus sp.]|nr:Helix-turn-helix type 11 domain protein [Paenibacillus sp.]
DPYGIVHWKNKWYVVGFCHLREQIRTFRVDRIGSCSRVDRTFQRPVGFSARDFLLSSLLAESGNGSGAEAISVHIQGIPQAIDDLCAHWLFGHALIDRTAEAAHFRIHELQLYTHAAYYLLSFGGKIRILGPEELKAHMVEITSDLLELYST